MMTLLLYFGPLNPVAETPLSVDGYVLGHTYPDAQISGGASNPS